MATIRVEKNKDNPYVMLNKFGINDSNLSWKAKGILLYLLSKPDDWKCQVHDLIKHAKDGRDSTYAGLRELRANGYMVKRPIKDEKGKVKEWEEVIYEVPNEEAKKIYESQLKSKPVDNVENEDKNPLTEKPDMDKNPLTDNPEMDKKEEKPLTEKPDMDNQDTEKPDTEKPEILISTDLPTNDLPINERESKEELPDLLNYIEDKINRPLDESQIAYIKEYWLNKISVSAFIKIISKHGFNDYQTMEKNLINDYAWLKSNKPELLE